MRLLAMAAICAVLKLTPTLCLIISAKTLRTMSTTRNQFSLNRAAAMRGPSRRGQDLMGIGPVPATE